MVDKELAPVLIGSIDAATADRWAAMSPDQIDLLSEAGHITPLEQQWAGGLIVGKAVVEVVDDQGAPTGRAVAFDARNLGDHSKDYDDNLKAAEGNTPNDNPESQRTTPEFDLQAVKDDPNLLLDTDIITKILSADRSKFDKPEDVDALKKQAEKEVIGPEQAALVVSEIAARAANNTIEDAEALQAMIGNIDPDSEYASSLETMSTTVAEMKECLYALQRQISSGEELDYSIINLANRLTETAGVYSDYHMHLLAIDEVAQANAGGVANLAEELKDRLLRVRDAAEYADGDSRQGAIDTNRTGEVIERVADRAPSTLQEHDEQTRQITSERLSAMHDVYAEAGEIEELGLSLMGGFRVRNIQFEELPSGGKLIAEADDIRDDLSRVITYGPMYVERVSEKINDLLMTIDIFESSLPRVSQVDQETQALLQTVKSRIMLLRSFGLYEAA